MNKKDYLILEEAYNKVLIKEAQDIDPKNTDHKHPFNRVDTDPHSGTQKPSSYKLPVVEADEEEEHVEKTEKEKVKDVDDKDKEGSSEYKKSKKGEKGDKEKMEVEEEGVDLLSVALNIIKKAKKEIIQESTPVVKVKVVRKPETDEFVVKVYFNGKYNEEASYYTNDKQDAIETKRDIVNRYKEKGFIIEEAKKQAWKKGSEYAICTASVGRKDEAKYKRCKKDVLASHKKSVAKKKKK